MSALDYPESTDSCGSGSRAVGPPPRVARATARANHQLAARPAEPARGQSCSSRRWQRRDRAARCRVSGRAGTLILTDLSPAMIATARRRPQPIASSYRMAASMQSCAAAGVPRNVRAASARTHMHERHQRQTASVYRSKDRRRRPTARPPTRPTSSSASTPPAKAPTSVSPARARPPTFTPPKLPTPLPSRIASKASPST